LTRRLDLEHEHVESMWYELKTKLHNILININYRSERQSHIYYSGADPGFQVRGAHLKKSRREEEDAKHFGVFRVKNHDFTTKKSYLFQLRREARKCLGYFV
jgi:hypothetical protein